MYVIDRIVNDIMVCEDSETRQNININRIENAKEGDVLKKVDNNFVIDLESTEKRKLEIKEKLKKLGL